MRIVIEEPCEHGEQAMHPTCNDLPGDPQHGLWCFCPGGSRRTLPEGSLVISKENGEWPAVAVDWPYEVIVALRHNWTDEGIALIHQQLTRSILDALAEGVPVGADK